MSFTMANRSDKYYAAWIIRYKLTSHTHSYVGSSWNWSNRVSTYWRIGIFDYENNYQVNQITGIANMIQSFHHMRGLDFLASYRPWD